MLMQIITMQMGFEVPAIQRALEATNYAGADQAVEYLFNANNSTAKPDSSNEKNKAQPKTISASEVQKLKERIKNMEIAGDFKIDITNAMVEKALQTNTGTDEAINYLMNEHQNLIIPNETSAKMNTNVNKSKIPILEKSESGRIFDPFENAIIGNGTDANAYKNMLKQQAIEKKHQKETAEVERQKLQKLNAEKYAFLEQERNKNRIKHEKNIENNRKALKFKKQKKTQKRKQNLLEWHMRHEEYEKDDKKRNEDLMNNRLKAESEIHSIQHAIQLMFDRYGKHFTCKVLNVLLKIMNKIIQHPKEKKYKKINLDHKKMQAMIVTPLGSMYILKQIGFRFCEEIDTVDKYVVYKYLIMDEFVMDDVQSAYDVCEKYSTIAETFVVQLVEDVRSDCDDEELYCALMSIHEILRNICISPMSEHLRYINVNGDIFHKRIGRFTKVLYIEHFLRVFEELGFKLQQSKNKSELVLRFDASKIPVTSAEHPQIMLMKDVLLDLTVVSKKVLRSTPIGEGVQRLYTLNNESNNALQLRNYRKLLQLLLKVLQHILDEPLNKKYSSISMNKLKQKYPNVVGIISLLKLLGFKNSHKKEPMLNVNAKRELIGVDGITVAKKKNISKVFEYRMKDLDLLKWRRMMLEQSVI